MADLHDAENCSIEFRREFREKCCDFEMTTNTKDILDLEKERSQPEIQVAARHRVLKVRSEVRRVLCEGSVVAPRIYIDQERYADGWLYKHKHQPETTMYHYLLLLI